MGGTGELERLVAAAQDRHAAGDLVGATELLVRARALVEDGTAEAARLDFSVARRYAEREEWTQAREWAQAAYAIARDLDPAIAWQSRLALATAMIGTGDVRDAIAVLEELERGLAAFPDSEQRAQAFVDLWSRLANAYRLAGRLDEALQTLERVRSAHVALDVTDPETVGGVLSDMGVLTAALGDPSGAVALFEQARGSIPERSENAGRLLTNIADAYRTLGRLGDAERAIRAAIEIQEEIGPETQSMARKWNTLGLIYADGREDEHARTALERSLRIHERVAPESAETANTTTNVGRWLLTTGDLTAARSRFRQAIELNDRTGHESPDAAGPLEMLALIESEEGRTAEAIALLDRAGEMLERVAPRSRELANVHHQRGELEEAAGRPGEAAVLYARALELRRLGGSPLDVAASLKALARLARLIGDLDRAVELLVETVELIEGARSVAGRDTLRDSLFSGQQTAYQDLIAALHRRDYAGDTELAFSYAERSRGRALLDMLRRRADQSDTDPASAALVRAERRRQAELAAAHAELAAARFGEGGDGGGELEERIENLEELLRRDQAALTDAFPAYAALEHPPQIEADEIRGALDGSTLLLEFDAIGEDTYVWALRADELGMYPLGLSGHDLDDKVSWVMVGFLGHSRRSTKQVRAALSRALLAAAPDRFWEGVERLLIVADGSLHYLPFELLPDPHDPDALLVDSYDVSYAPSASIWARLRERPRRGDGRELSLAAFANPLLTEEAAERWRQRGLELAPLAGAEREVEQIAGRFPGPAETYAGAQATEARVRAAVAGRTHVHFATHGVFDDRGALYSGLLLAMPTEQELAASGDRQLDDFLQAFEIPDLPLDADLVVLSACLTAVGHLHQGEGLVGTTRALFAAGARCVVASLWQVPDDATAALMTAFYDELAGGADVAGALRRAKLALRDEGRFADPSEWAGFVALGAGW